MSRVHLSVAGLLATAFLLQEIGKAVSDCPPDWLLFRKNCFGLFTRKLTWAEAEKDCQSYGSTGHLLSITSKTEDTIVNAFMNYNFNKDEGIWIGLFEHGKKGLWQWSNRSPIDYTAWNIDKPSNKEIMACVHLSSKSGHKKWNDAPCSMKMNYMCMLELH